MICSYAGGGSRGSSVLRTNLLWMGTSPGLGSTPVILNQVDGATPRLRRRMAQMANITSMNTTTMAAIILPTMAPACLWCSFVSP